MNYAGIGSRTITADEIVKIEKVASFLNEKDAILYSGNADGADITFQKYAKSFVAYLPWSKFNYNSFDVSTNLNCLKVYDSQTKDAFDSIDLFHPNPKALSPAARKLMARNYYQINGRDEYKTVNFVVFVANEKKGNVEGGTGQAIRIARSLNIPTFNLRDNTAEDIISQIKLIS
jgi:hypothetical protein